MSSSIDTASLIGSIRALQMGYAQKNTPDLERIASLPWTRRDIGDMYYIKDSLDWLLNEIKSGFSITEDRHGRTIRNLMEIGRALNEKETAYHAKYNSNHKPAGSPNSTGGEFDFAPGGGGSGRDGGNSGGASYPSVPRRPDGKITVSVADWRKYHDSLRKTPKVSATEQRAHAEVFAAEGGYKADGKTYAGITTGALDHAKSNPAIKEKLGNINTPQDLAKYPELIPQIYKAHIDHSLRRTGVSDPLDKVGDTHAAAALADTIFREGEAKGGNMIKKAVLYTNPNLAKELDDEGGIIKEKTFAAYSKLAKNPATLGNLLDSLAVARSEGPHGGEQGRIEHFRFEKERKK